MISSLEKKKKTRKNPDKYVSHALPFLPEMIITESKNVLRVPLVYYISVFTLGMLNLKIIKRKKTLFLVQIELNDPYKRNPVYLRKSETITK